MAKVQQASGGLTSISSPKKRRRVGSFGFQTCLTAVCVLLALYLFLVGHRANHLTASSQAGLLVSTSGRDMQTKQSESANNNNNVNLRSSASAEAAAIEPQSSSSSSSEHKVAGLSCEKYGGPPDEKAQEMIFWRDIPEDAQFESPFKRVGPEVKYLTFEPDEGGWNNIRMAMETAVTMALAMGRILVLPPEQGMYLLHKNDKGQKNKFTFKDFFHFDSVEMEHPTLTVISFEEFLKREAMTGHLKNTKTGEVSFPPHNQTNWDGKFINYEAGKKGVFPWLRSVTKKIDWNMDKCLAAFPKEPGASGVNSLKMALKDAKAKMAGIGRQNRINSYNGNPTPVDAPPEARIREMLANREELCIYDEDFQQATVVHAQGDNDSGARMLIHFYSFLFFEDYRHDLWTKRFVRDHLRYVDEIQCAAARFVDFLRFKSRSFGDPDGTFYTMHIRRGDFQYKDTRIEADVIYENVRDLIPPKSVLYIATDEKTRSFFDIFSKNYRVYFLDSNPTLLQGINTNFLGMLDQLVASKGKVFVGTYYSTFSGYINRVRGYRSQIEKLPGYEKGEIESYYYVPLHAKYAVKEYRPPHPPFWAREFPIGWRDIDKSVTI